MKEYITAKTFPLDLETGKFQSNSAEAAFEEAADQGICVGRHSIRRILQAYQCAQDKCDREYAKWHPAHEEEETS